MEPRLPDPAQRARLRRFLLISALVVAVTTPVVIGLVRYARRPPPPYTPASATVALPSGEEAPLNARDAAVRLAAGEVVAALQRPVLFGQRGAAALEEFLSAGGGPVLAFTFNPPLATPHGAVRRISISGTERTHRTALVAFESGDEAVMLLLPRLRWRHWMARRYARATDAVFTAGLRRLQLAMPPPTTEPADGTGPAVPTDPSVSQ